MARLIDADALYERIRKETSYDLDFFDSELRQIIESQPTAYDVEEVVAEIGELDTYKGIIMSGKHPFAASEIELVSKKKAIEKVRRGGVT